VNGDNFPPELLGPCSKLRSYCARFALVIHLLRVACGEAGSDSDEGQVDGEDVARAGRLCVYFLAHARAVYRRLRETVEDRSVEDLISWLQRKQRGSCTPRDVCRANVCGITTGSAAERLLQAAVDRGYGEWEGSQDAAKKATRRKTFVVGPAQ
jgi:hypothetical protein